MPADLGLTCQNRETGGDKAATSDILVTFNTNITNLALLSLDPSGQTTDAVLLKDENSGQPVTPGTNAFYGVLAGPNAIRFHNVPLAPDDAEHNLRITNVRVDANAVASVFPPIVVATVSITRDGPLTLASGPASCVSPVHGSPREPIVCIAGQIAASSVFHMGTPSVGGPTFGNTVIQTLNFSELFVSAYRSQKGESGFMNPALAPGTGAATNGTRLVVNFSGVPAGVNLYAPVDPATGSNAQLVSADNNGVGGFPVTGIVTIHGATVAGYQQIVLTGGAGSVTWELTGGDGGALETLAFNLLVDGNVALSAVQVTGFLGPRVLITGPSAMAPIPRFGR
jgi:hypothetical protein